MKPVEFKHQNTVFAKDQPQHKPLTPSYLTANRKEVFSCPDDKLSFFEKMKLNFKRKGK